MERSRDRILTTHTGSLPRPADLLKILAAREAEEPVDERDFEAEVARSVKYVVDRQVGAGVDVVNDGEMGKPSYATYIRDRMTGFTGEAPQWPGRPAALDEFPDLEHHFLESWRATIPLRRTSCNGPISFERLDLVHKDIDTFRSALAGSEAAGAFLSAASPGIIGIYFPNQFFASEADYLGAVAEAMRNEYNAIYESGFVLQLDCPDLAFAEPNDGALAERRRMIEMRIEALNHAVRDIPAEAMRMHVCWGNGEWPRTHDVALAGIIDILLKAKPAGIMLMAANGRHAHEWKVFEDVKLPDGKYLIPGVIDPTTNIVEHPELIAQRLTNYTRLVGVENVMAGVDCGFGTVAGMQRVAPSVVWAKFRSMREGADRATAASVASR